MPPKLPGIRRTVPNVLGSVKGAIRRGHEQVGKASSDIRSIGEELRGFSLAEPRTPTTASVVAGKPTAGVSDKDTLLYQFDHLVSVLKQMETHLAEGCRIMGTPCDCCGKHAMEARTWAMETISIAARMDKPTSIYQAISDWASRIEEIDTPEKVASGEYDELYRKESGTASNFRKKVQSMIAELKQEDDCPGCEEMRETLGKFIEQKKKERR